MANTIRVAIDFGKSTDTINAATGGKSTIGASLLVVSIASTQPLTSFTDTFNNTWQLGRITTYNGVYLSTYYAVTPSTGANHIFSVAAGNMANPGFPALTMQAYGGNIFVYNGIFNEDFVVAQQVPVGVISSVTPGALEVTSVAYGGTIPITVDNGFSLTNDVQGVSSLSLGVASADILNNNVLVAPTWTLISGAGTLVANILQFSINIVTPPVVNPPSPNVGVVGSAYLSVGNIVGGQAPYTVSIVSGSLPSGIFITSSNGNISGTPVFGGTYTFQERVSDVYGQVYISNPYTITIFGPLNWSTDFTSLLNEGQSVTVPLSQFVSGGSPPYTYSIKSGSLPAGLTLGNPMPGVVGGTPTATGTSTVVFQAVDIALATVSGTGTFKVSGPTISCGTSGTATLGVSYSSVLPFTGTNTPITFSISSGALPGGVSLASNTLSGVPLSVGTFSFTEQITDAFGATNTANCAITIVTGTATNTGTGTGTTTTTTVSTSFQAVCPVGVAIVNQFYSGAGIVLGGTAPYTWSITSGSLPFTLNAGNGALTGTATVTGQLPYTLKVVDSGTNTSVISCSINVITTQTGLYSGNVFKHFNTYYDARNEPAKINYFRTDIESLEENICEGFDVDINPNGTATGIVYIDNAQVVVATFTGTKRQSFTTSIPVNTYPFNTYGRTLYVVYTGAGFKHYKTWWHLRPEPDRWTQYISAKVTGDEREIKIFKPEINPMGNVVLATTLVDGIPTSTHTITGGHRLQYTLSMPYEIFGRTVNAAYQVISTSGARFKHYTTEFEGPTEPARVSQIRFGPVPYDSDHWLKTWQPQLDCVSGTVTGTLIVEDIAIQTSTFTGTRKQWYTVGVDLNPKVDYILQTGSRWEARYACDTGEFKHYQTKMESDIDPFRKVSWSFHYRKIGGATQLDVGRFWSMFSDVSDQLNDAPIVATCWWDLDGDNFNVTTLTLGSGHLFTDRIPFPPGMRGRLFEFRCYAPKTVKIHNVNIDLMEDGIKNLTRRGHPGTPQENE